MRRAVVFVAALLIASLGVVAQSEQSAENSAQRTVQVSGCLGARNAAGQYVLTEPSGAAYMLSGDTASLQGHAGQQVEVTGQLQSGSNTLSNGSPSGSAGSSPSDATEGRNTDLGTIQVTNARVVSEHCDSANLQPSTGDTKPQASAVRLQQITNPPQNAATDSSSAGVEKSASDKDRDADGTNSKQLPQTSTMLPLLGLIGLGSLVAGFFARR